MSSLFQSLTDTTGVVKTRVSATAPAGSNIHRRILVDSAGAVVITRDTGQVRYFVGGIAIEASTGIVLVSGSATPFLIAPGGVQVDQNGSLQVKAGPSLDVVHQGVGLLNNGTVVCSNIPP